MIAKPILLYGRECWPIKNSQVQKMKVAEMRMLHWICHHLRLDRIKNVVIRNKTGVASIEDKMKETKLRWFGRIMRNSIDTSVKTHERIVLPSCRRGQESPGKNLERSD